ncbi:hypothetical protein BDM02DRAFT_3182802 [Thelephora ganbajun]|uniref:Uncharacterized protein n=1 Tax=Thelephora ganbajun TaxID=370292 RepID=A0ACB6ZUW2_THEGA|nr:hypothetical protein BDM02DRAFT_3182802 [Thelephora ganbajun]
MSEVLAILEKAARYLMVVKAIYATVCMGALVVYEYMLTLDDELRYVWERKKSWIFYLFVAVRSLVSGTAFILQVDHRIATCCSFMPYGSEIVLKPTEMAYPVVQCHAHHLTADIRCARNVLLTSILVLFFLLSSDCFMTLRVYAVMGRNKLIGLYMSFLMCAKVATSIFFISRLHSNTIKLPDIPIDAFRSCTPSGSFTLQIIPCAIGAVFDISAFCFIIWFAYSSTVIFRFSSLLRTIVEHATVYFIMAMILKILVLLFLLFADSAMKQSPPLLHAIVTPLLINRVALSLKKSADKGYTANQPWDVDHFSSIEFEPVSIAATSEAFASHPQDGQTEARLNTERNDIRLDEPTQC